MTMHNFVLTRGHDIVDDALVCETKKLQYAQSDEAKSFRVATDLHRIVADISFQIRGHDRHAGRSVSRPRTYLDSRDDGLKRKPRKSGKNFVAARTVIRSAN